MRCSHLRMRIALTMTKPVKDVPVVFDGARFWTSCEHRCSISFLFSIYFWSEDGGEIIFFELELGCRCCWRVYNVGLRVVYAV